MIKPAGTIYFTTHKFCSVYTFARFGIISRWLSCECGCGRSVRARYPEVDDDNLLFEMRILLTQSDLVLIFLGNAVCFIFHLAFLRPRAGGSSKCSTYIHSLNTPKGKKSSFLNFDRDNCVYLEQRRSNRLRVAGPYRTLQGAPSLV